jgi:hypothetical protein
MRRHSTSREADVTDYSARMVVVLIWNSQDLLTVSGVEMPDRPLSLVGFLMDWLIERNGVPAGGSVDVPGGFAL